jgi:uncharacterized protein YndB with AHSA1/START domain
MTKPAKETRVKDRISKKAVFHAPRNRVWQAISNAREFGTWFGLKTDDSFEEGAQVSGTIAPTAVDQEVAALQRPHEGMPFEMTIERIEPQRLFEFLWHPFAIERDRDYSDEPMTLVSFDLEENDDGTQLTITESGFGQLPKDRRAEALKANEDGWEKQLQLIEKYLQRTVAGAKSESKSRAKGRKASAIDEQTLRDLEERFWEALKERDVETALALTDFPCIVAGPQGRGQHRPAGVRRDDERRQVHDQ